MQKAAIIILNYNGEDMLRKFLPDVVKFSNYEIIVADNGSTDGSISFLQNNFPHLTTILLGSNNGFSQGYNLALDQLEGDYGYYILLNSDILVTEDWDKRMISWMDLNPSIVAAQPKILSYQQQDYFDHAGAGGGFLDQLGYPYCRGRILNHVEKDDHQYDDPIPVDWASGACLFIRALDFHKAGGFEKVFFAHMEEIDLCWRLRLLGKKIFYNGEVTVYHVNGGTLSRNSPTKTYLNFRNNLLMLYKNLSNAAFLKVFAIRIFFDFVALLQFSFSEGLAHGKAVINAYLDFLALKNSVRKTCPLASKLTRVDQGKKIHSIVITYYLKRKRTFSEI
jgi:GT2 family glycosyltransferase